MNAPVCVVTGGAGHGIGRGICEAVARAGFVVIVADVDDDTARSLTEELVEEGYESEARHLDVSDAEQVAAFFSDVANRWGRLDGLVNSAGVGLVKPAADVTLEEWASVVDTDLRGAWLCSKAAIPVMIAGGGGSVVNIGSVQAIGPHTGYAIYSAAKAGLAGLTRGIAADYGRDRIRCNLVHPGLVDSDQTRHILADMGHDPQEWMDRYLRTRQMIPAPVTPHDVGAVVSFLLGSQAQSVTGAEIVVDAGSSAMAFDRSDTETR